MYRDVTDVTEMSFLVSKSKHSAAQN